MEINHIIKINKKFGGTVINRSSLDFALEQSKKEKNIYKANAYLIRGIIIDHAFLDGNKRTALTLLTKTFKDNGVKCNKERLVSGIIKIAKNNVHQINKIEGRLRKWCLKN